MKCITCNKNDVPAVEIGGKSVQLGGICDPCLEKAKLTEERPVKGMVSEKQWVGYTDASLKKHPHKQLVQNLLDERKAGGQQNTIISGNTRNGKTYGLYLLAKKIEELEPSATQLAVNGTAFRYDLPAFGNDLQVKSFVAKYTRPDHLFLDDMAQMNGKTAEEALFHIVESRKRLRKPIHISLQVTQREYINGANYQPNNPDYIAIRRREAIISRLIEGANIHKFA